MFERYVNFEFYKLMGASFKATAVWEICKFWILQTQKNWDRFHAFVWEICKFWILQTLNEKKRENQCLRDM